MNGVSTLRLLAVTVAFAVPAGCSNESWTALSPPVPGQSNPTSVGTAGGRCPVTLPNGNAPNKVDGFNHGNGSLWVAVWPRGKLVAGPLPDGGSWATIEADGSIEAKLGWWRGVEGELAIGGRRLDASAPSLQAHVPDGYGPSGFQPSGIIFPTEGCWQITGKVARVSLTFVTFVAKVS